MTELEFIEKFKNGKIKNIKRVLNLIMLTIETENGEIIKFHIQCYIRFLNGDKLLFSSENLFCPKKGYKRKPFEKFNYAKVGNTSFDELLEEIRNDVENVAIKEVVKSFDDLTLKLANNFSIEIIRNLAEDFNSYTENYRIWSDDIDCEIIK